MSKINIFYYHILLSLILSKNKKILIKVKEYFMRGKNTIFSSLFWSFGTAFFLNIHIWPSFYFMHILHAPGTNAQGLFEWGMGRGVSTLKGSRSVTIRKTKLDEILSGMLVMHSQGRPPGRERESWRKRDRMRGKRKWWSREWDQGQYGRKKNREEKTDCGDKRRKKGEQKFMRRSQAIKSYWTWNAENREHIGFYRSIYIW